MSRKKIRIGIDVGGTFTHAVALDHQSYQVVAHAVTPTTHSSAYSVSEGIIKTFEDVLAQSGAAAEDVVFVAHSTTQSTNALLEGDVARVGIVGMGKGLEAVRAKADTSISDLELSEGKYLYTENIYLNSDSADFSKAAEKAVAYLASKGCSVVVASEAFGVDDACHEEIVLKAASAQGILAAASHEISQLYGLKVRTRTAVINASILPKMTQTADMTNKSIQKSNITAPLMIMRSDGGVMDMEQMKKRPVLTLLSGPAAGIAAALMYVNVSDGIFLETGGTSTDISAIKNGRAMLKSARVGGHSTFLKTLDSRTVGIGGGSMIRLGKDGKVTDTGPRSAHIAGLKYLAFAPSGAIDGSIPLLISPMPGDPPDYVILKNPKGESFALTLTDAAMMAGMVHKNDYAYGCMQNVEAGFHALAAAFKTDEKTLCESILDKAAEKVNAIVRDLLIEYELDPDLTALVGGGGGCTTIVPWLSKKNRMNYRIAEKAEVISAIGAAMAMLRDSVEKTVINPTEKDISGVRRQAIDSLLSMGAFPESIEVQMEIDQQKNIVRATATGSIEMENQDFTKAEIPEEELLRQAAASLKEVTSSVALAANTTGLNIYNARAAGKGFFSFLKGRTQNYRVLDHYGVVKLQINNGELLQTTVSDSVSDIDRFLQDVSDYSDAGQILPEVYLLYGSRIVDFSSVLEQTQVESLMKMELNGMPDNTSIVLLAKHR